VPGDKPDYSDFCESPEGSPVDFVLGTARLQSDTNSHSNKYE
jgi:hypothetical protein